jgi:DNA-binding HxlR family transcriptional regulator
MEPSMATIIAAIIGAVATIVADVLAAILARRGRGPKPPVNGDSQGWQERNVEGPDPMWPQQQSFDALERLLERSSNKNRLLLLHVARAKRSIANEDLMEKTGLAKGELRYRMKELERLQLVEMLPATTIKYKLDDRVLKTLGPDGKGVLIKLLE